MMNRLFPPAAAARPGVNNNDDTSQHDNSRARSIVQLHKNQLETPARGNSNNAEEISALSVETPAAAQSHKLDGSGFMSATQFANFIATLKLGDDFQAKAADYCKNITLTTIKPTNDNPNNDLNVPSSIGELPCNSSCATPPNPSPIRVLRNPYNKKVYYSREYTPREIETMAMLEKEASRLERCTSLCLINSIREDNFIEDSFMASTIASGDDSSPNKKLFQSLQPYSLTTDTHSMAIEKLYEHYKHLFLFPKCRYIQQYFHNKRIREMKSLEKAFSSEQVAYRRLHNTWSKLQTMMKTAVPQIHSSIQSLMTGWTSSHANVQLSKRPKC